MSVSIDVRVYIMGVWVCVIPSLHDEAGSTNLIMTLLSICPHLSHPHMIRVCQGIHLACVQDMNIETVERVQRRFTKRLPGFKNLTYTERLKRLKLPSLELRRLYNDLTWCYKILFGYVDVSSDEFFAPSPAVHTRGQPYKLFKKHSTICSRQTFFSERVPYDIVCFNSLNTFKRSIVCVNLKSFLQCY